MDRRYKRLLTLKGIDLFVEKQVGLGGVVSTDLRCLNSLDVQSKSRVVTILRPICSAFPAIDPKSGFPRQ
jgi:hypothetical protein